MSSEEMDSSSDVMDSDDIESLSSDVEEESDEEEEEGDVDSADDDDDDDDVDDDDDNDDDDDDDDDDPWSKLVNEVFKHYHDDMREAVKELVEDGTSRKRAEIQVYREFLPEMNKRLQSKFVKFLQHVREFKRDSTYAKIMETAQRLRTEEDMDFEESVAQAADTRQLLITRVLKEWKPTFDYEEEEM